MKDGNHGSQVDSSRLCFPPTRRFKSKTVRKSNKKQGIKNFTFSYHIQKNAAISPIKFQMRRMTMNELSPTGGLRLQVWPVLAQIYFSWKNCLDHFLKGITFHSHVKDQKKQMTKFQEKFKKNPILGHFGPKFAQKEFF